MDYSESAKYLLESELGKHLVAWCESTANDYRRQASSKSMEECYALCNKADGVTELVNYLNAIASTTKQQDK